MRILTTLLCATIIATPALAAISVGTTVRDTTGAVVGTITRIAGANVIVDTGNNKVTVPKTSLTDTPKGPLMAMTKLQLDAAVEQAAADRKAKLANAIQPGAAVRGSQGVIIGTITELAGEFVNIKGAAGVARIPKRDLSLKADGLHFGMTAAEFAKAVKASMANNDTTS